MVENIRILILAAGKGTRMKSKKAKVLHRAAGRSLIEHVLRVARSVSANVSLVAGHQAERLKELLPGENFVDQEEQLGTGHAVMAAQESFSGYVGDLLVLPGDVPLIQTETLEAFIRFHRQHGYRASVLTAEVVNPLGYGRIVRRNENEIDAIVEHRDASPEILKINEINSGIYAFAAPVLFGALTKIRNTNTQGEYYLTDVVAVLAGEKLKVGAWKTQNPNEILGINTRQELATVDRLMRQRKCDSLMTQGVTIVDPSSTFIDADVEIGSDTVIHPSVQITGSSVIGDDVTIHSFSRISNTRIGARSVILEGCVIGDSILGEAVSVGPCAHLRPDTILADAVKVGDFVEIKNSKLGESSRAMHLAYLGDATIGKNVNIGAGTITCNFDGKTKNPTIIEDNVFIGSDSQLIAPVRVRRGAYVAAGSSITEDVPAESLAIARGRQTVKDGWVKKIRKRK